MISAPGIFLKLKGETIMSEIFFLLAVLVFLVFLKMGLASIFKRTGGKWIFLSISAVSLIAAVVLFNYSQWNVPNIWNANEAITPRTGEVMNDER